MNPFKSFFEKIRANRQRWYTYGGIAGTQANIGGFGLDASQSEIVRTCVRTLADHTSKAFPSCSNKRIETILKYKPSLFMTGKDFLYKVRYQYDLQNTAFVVIIRDENGISGFYPMPYESYNAVELEDGSVAVYFSTGSGNYLFDINDLIILRKDYNKRDIGGDENTTILNTLELIKVSNDSIKNAVKSTANLRGILQSKKSMLDVEDQKEERDEFVKNYLSSANAGGVAVLDATMEFTPINMSPQVTNWATMKEFREDVYRYFGVNDDIIMGKATPEQMQVFYESSIEPFLIALSLEMTRKIFTDREMAFGNSVVYNSSQIQFMSMSDKLALKDYIDRGALTPNMWCDIVGLPHVEGGDQPLRRLDTAPVDQIAQSLQEDDTKEESSE